MVLAEVLSHVESNYIVILNDVIIARFTPPWTKAICCTSNSVRIVSELFFGVFM